MSQRIATREREPEPQKDLYEEVVEENKRRREQMSTGSVVLHAKETEWEQGRQGRVRYFSHFRYWPKLAAPGWMVFEQDIRRHSGKHIHQGGLNIFVLEGRGYTVVDGVRYDWKKGDLIVLPIKPEGCEHQHFNLDEGQPCCWMAFVYRPLKDALGQEFRQVEVSPDWSPG